MCSRRAGSCCRAAGAAMNSRTFPTQARVVIIGGGVIGCSVAYHLSKLGWTDVVLLERKQLTSGTTWHAAGLLTTLRDTETQTRLAKYTQDLYRRLEAETGQATGLIGCGSIQLAMTADKAHEMRRGINMAQSFGVEAHEISASDVKALWPLAEVGDLAAAFHFPNDARANPTDVTQALARGARQGGVQIFEHTRVTGVICEDGAVAGVQTDQGDIRAEFVVNCAGMWAREVGRLAGVNVPLQAAEHYYLISEPVPGVHPLLPILRDPGNCAYLREEAGKVMVGLFEPMGEPWGINGIPEDFSFGEIPPNWERMYPVIEKAMQRVPCLLQTGIKLLFCGPESFTPDHNYLMGEAPNLRRFFVAAGFNSLGILSGGGVGYVMAEWLVNGRPPMDVWSVNLRRMHAWQNNRTYLSIARVRRSASATRIIGRSGSGALRAASGKAFCTTAWPARAPALESRRAGNAQTGTRRPARRLNTGTVGSGKTGSLTMQGNTVRCVSRWESLNNPRSLN